MATDRKSAQRGYAIPEIVVYISILAVIFVLIVNTVMTFSGSYRRLRAVRLIEHSATNAMERMTRDIRGAAGVVTASSTLGVSPGILTVASSATTTRFYVDDGILRMDVNGAFAGPMTLSNTEVSNLVFTPIATAESEAVKIDMTITSTVGSMTKVKTYHATVVLQGS